MFYHIFKQILRRPNNTRQKQNLTIYSDQIIINMFQWKSPYLHRYMFVEFTTQLPAARNSSSRRKRRQYTGQEFVIERLQQHRIGTNKCTRIAGVKTTSEFNNALNYIALQEPKARAHKRTSEENVDMQKLHPTLTLLWCSVQVSKLL